MVEIRFILGTFRSTHCPLTCKPLWLTIVKCANTLWSQDSTLPPSTLPPSNSTSYVCMTMKSDKMPQQLALTSKHLASTWVWRQKITNNNLFLSAREQKTNASNANTSGVLSHLYKPTTSAWLALWPVFIIRPHFFPLGSWQSNSVSCKRPATGKCLYQFVNWSK